MKSRFISYLLISVLMLSACGGAEPTADISSESTDEIAVQDEPLFAKQQAVIDKPFEDVDVPFETFNYDNRKTNVYELPSGTRIEVPKDAFVDNQGNSVQDDIEISYREMHDLEDIIISGIKMNYEEEDTSGDFESAGMFEIRANQQEENLELKPGKEIKVDFASYKEGKFKSYEMNEATANWEYIEEREAVQNTRKQQKINEARAQLDALEFVCQIEPREMNASDPIVDLDYRFDEHPELKIFNSAVWLIAGGKSEQDKFNGLSATYDDISIAESDSCNYFELTLWGTRKSDGTRDKTSFLAQPVWKGKAYRKAKRNYKKKVKEYEKTRKNLEDMEERAEREADLVRKFELKGLGIFNCDRILNFIKFTAAALVLTCKEKIKNFFFITLKRKASIKFYDPTVSNFKYDPQGFNSIIAILPDNKVGTVSEEEFDKAVEKLMKKETDRLELELKVQKEKVKSKKDLSNNLPSF